MTTASELLQYLASPSHFYKTQGADIITNCMLLYHDQEWKISNNSRLFEHVEFSFGNCPKIISIRDKQYWLLIGYSYHVRTYSCTVILCQYCIVNTVSVAHFKKLKNYKHLLKLLFQRVDYQKLGLI